MSPLIIDNGGRFHKATTSRCRFTVASAETQDVRRLVDIEFHAFENERVNQVLSYRDYKKPAHLERSVQMYQDAINDGTSTSKIQRIDSRLEIQRPGSRISFNKAIDNETAEIVSFTKFEIKSYSKAQLGMSADAGYEAEPKMQRDWFALNERLRREYVGSARHCCEHSLKPELAANNFHD